MLFFTYANAKFHIFATLYPLFALTSNPEAVVEIILSDYKRFEDNYSNIMEFYDTNYPGKVRYTSVDANPLMKKTTAQTIRFLIQPTVKAKYVYIGDIDILLMEDVLNYWLEFMKRHQCDFGNILRNDHQLTGVHFIPYEKMYPIIIPPDLDLWKTRDEIVLYHLMKEKNLRLPVNANGAERLIHGIHISFYSRQPLCSLTTFDKYVPVSSWNCPMDKHVEKYLEIRYTEPIIKFTECIENRQVELRRIIQFIDMWAFFLKMHPGNAIFDRNAAPDKITSSKKEKSSEPLPKQKEEQSTISYYTKKYLDFLSNQDYHTACDQQNIENLFKD